jgi:hypothetical protein
MGQILTVSKELFEYTSAYYGGFFYFLMGDGSTSPYAVRMTEWNFPYLRPVPEVDSPEALLFKQHARIHLYSLASMFYLYDKPHYRKGSYRDDLIDNLRNVAIPGTGIPLSLLVRSKYLAMLALLTVYPTVSLIAAFHKWFMSRFEENLSAEYATRLLAPDDWFNYWRLNCNVVGLHSLLNDFPPGYEMENKWTFLEEGSKRGVPVSPYLKSPSAIVVKHRNEEGGLGIFFYRNAAHGGDWIIQERIQNSEWVSTLLPPKAPLSTFRVITQSRASLDLSKTPLLNDVTALSCVFRAGRQGASTDHDSILFDVDVKTGLIRGGTTNAHWYRLGLYQALPGNCPWRSPHHFKSHPDGDIPVSGNYVPDIAKLLNLVEKAHLTLCPDVPFCVSLKMMWPVHSSSTHRCNCLIRRVGMLC